MASQSTIYTLFICCLYPYSVLCILTFSVMLIKIKSFNKICYVYNINLKGSITILKIQANHTMVIAAFEDFILTVYVYVV